MPDGGAAAELSSRITDVTVFRVGAFVTRVAELVRGGADYPARVLIGGLPLGLDDASVRVRVEGGSPLPFAADVRITLAVPARDESLAPPDDAELRAARVERARLDLETKRLERDLGRLGRLELKARPPGEEGKPPGASPLDARLALLELREREWARLAAERLDAYERLGRASDRVAALEARLRTATSARQAREHEMRKCAVIGLRETGASGDGARIVLEYVVPSARWAPSYVLRLDDSLEKAELALRAVVAQRTGEDWSGVRLRLSTAFAQQWVDVPEMLAIRIGRRQSPPARRAWRPPPTGARELYADYDRARVPAAAGGWQGAPTDVRPPVPRAAPVAIADDGPASEEQYHDAEVTPAVPMAPPPMQAPGRGAGGAPPPGPASFGAPFEQQSSMVGRTPVAPAASAPRLAAPSGMVAPRRSALAKSASMDVSRSGVAAAQPEFLSEEATDGGGPARIGIDPRLLAYPQLRMPPPDDSRRGQLVTADPREGYLELFVATRIEVTVDVLATVRDARRLAAALAPFPARLRPPEPEAGFDHAYDAETPVDVPADGEPHSIPVLHGAGAARGRHVVVPRESTDVFRTVELDNPIDGPLLEGPVDTYVGPDFLLTADVHATPPGGRLVLGLGVDQAIKVARNTSFREETVGLMRGSLDLEHEIAIEITSHAKAPTTIDVRERVPVAREGDDEVKISVTTVEPAWKPWEPREGKLLGGFAWTITVPPSGTQKLIARYSVRIPSKNELVGGNRREG